MNNHTIKRTLFIGGGIFLLIVVFIVGARLMGNEEKLATCLADRGAVLYGLFWDESTQEQLAHFSGSADALPYIECSTEDGTRIQEVCLAAQVTAFPLWVLPGGERVSGALAPEELAEKSGCKR